MTLAKELAEKYAAEWAALLGESFNHAGTADDPHDPDDCLACHIARAIDEALEMSAKIADDYDFEGTACADRIRALKSDNHQPPIVHPKGTQSNLGEGD